MRARGLSLLLALVIAWAVSPAFGQGIFSDPPKGPEKWPLPPASAQQAAIKAVEEAYKDEIAGAKTPAQRRALAERLLAAAAEADDPAERFVLIRTAREMASQAGDAALALRAADAAAGSFQGDAFAEKVESLETAARAGAGGEQPKVVAEAAAGLADEALLRDEFETAARLNRLAVALARKTRDPALSARLSAQAREVEKASRAYRKVQTAQETLERSPGDPEANLTVGRYLCLVKGQWDKGLSMLALGADEKMKSLAERELRGAAGTSAQVALADGWWDLAEQEEGTARQRLQDRAAHWYRQALPQLSGLEKTKVEKRVAESARSVGSVAQQGKRHYLDPDNIKNVAFLTFTPATKSWKNDAARLFRVEKADDGYKVACGADGVWKWKMMVFAKEDVTAKKLVASLTVVQGKCTVGLRAAHIPPNGPWAAIPAGAKHSVELWVQDGAAHATLDGKPLAIEDNEPATFGVFAIPVMEQTVVVFHDLRFEPLK